MSIAKIFMSESLSAYLHLELAIKNAKYKTINYFYTKKNSDQGIKSKVLEFLLESVVSNKYQIKRSI